MLLGAYSLFGEPATITYEFPEHHCSAKDTGSSLDFRYADAQQVETPIDHFTCHADGRFHAKTRDDAELYAHVEQRGEALSPDTGPFLDVLVVSDVVARYQRIESAPKAPHVWMQTVPEAIISLNCLFAGADYPIQRDAVLSMARRGRNAGAVLLVSGTIYGAVWGRPREISDEARKTRPNGTLLVFRWPRENDEWGLKAFILN
jgi:hypothetical protein